MAGCRSAVEGVPIHDHPFEYWDVVKDEFHILRGTLKHLSRKVGAASHVALLRVVLATRPTTIVLHSAIEAERQCVRRGGKEFIERARAYQFQRRSQPRHDFVLIQ